MKNLTTSEMTLITGCKYWADLYNKIKRASQDRYETVIIEFNPCIQYRSDDNDSTVLFEVQKIEISIIQIKANAFDEIKEAGLNL